jgi:NTE family protein
MFYFDNIEIVKRLKKYPVLSHFSESALRKLVTQSHTLTLSAGKILFTQSETSDSVYYLIDGHLECFSSDTFTKKVASLRSGEMVGEMGVIAGETRGMTVRSTRDSTLLKIDKDIFINFFQKSPELLTVLAQTMAKRLRQMIMNLQEAHYEFKNIGIVALSADLSFEKMREIFNLHIALDHVHLYEHQDFESSKMELTPFFSECEEHDGINLFFSKSSEEDWSHAVLNHVDYIYLVTKEGAWSMIDPDILSRIRQRPCDLVIFHSTEGPYTDTAKFYLRYPFKRHHHITNTRADYERLYRFLTGQAIGLVISGGGFRGFAHYGLVKALFEARVPIDFIGGSSMGAAIGALLAMKFDWQSFDVLFNQSMQELKRVSLWKHITYPALSLLSGATLTGMIKKIYGAYQIEDLSLNFYCIVANLSKTRKDVKRSGELWEWLRASTAIPGALPPLEKNGSVYVDGGVCTNLPVLDMREVLDNVGKIIAFDIRIPPFGQDNYTFPPVLTLKDLLAYKLGFAKNRYVFPALIDVVMEASFINQYIYDTQGARGADIMVAPDTSSVGFSQSKNSDSLIQMAYELAQKKFLEKRSVYERWIIS